MDIEVEEDVFIQEREIEHITLGERMIECSKLKELGRFSNLFKGSNQW